MTTVGARIVTWLVALVIGIVYGAAGTIGHAFVLGPVPVGLILALIGSAALLLALRLLVDDRWAVVAAGVGMIGTALVFSGRGPGGSVIVPSGILGIVWTIALPIAITLVVAWPSPRALRRAAASSPDTAK